MAAVAAPHESGLSERPSENTTLYVGDLCPTVTPPELLAFCQEAGVVTTVHICRSAITQEPLGYGYVNYSDPAGAQRALETLNFKKLGQRPVRLMYKERNPANAVSSIGNIFVKNLKPEIDSKALFDLFKAFGKVLTCKVMENENGTSRGYGFVHFKDEDDAKTAIIKMNGNKEIAAPEADALRVEQFIRRNARIAALMLNFTNVYIKQILPTVDKDTLAKFFSKFGGIKSVVTKKDPKGRVFAFCDFSTHDDAVKAITDIHDRPVDGLTQDNEPIYVQRAQTRSERLVELRAKYAQRQPHANNLYVRNFPPEFTDDDLRELFAGFGDIKSCKIMRNKLGESLKFGFVSFAHAEQATKALQEMAMRQIKGRVLVVNIAQRRDQRMTMLKMNMRRLLQGAPAMMPFVAGASPMPPQQYAALYPPPPQQQPQHAPMQGQPTPKQRRRVPVAAPAPNPHQTPKYTVSRTPGMSPMMAPELEPALTLEALRSMPPDDAINIVGERLFSKIELIDKDNTAKITGMILELGMEQAYALLENEKELMKKIGEAQDVLLKAEQR